MTLHHHLLPTAKSRPRPEPKVHNSQLFVPIIVDLQMQHTSLTCTSAGIGEQQQRVLCATNRGSGLAWVLPLCSRCASTPSATPSFNPSLKRRAGGQGGHLDQLRIPRAAMVAFGPHFPACRGQMLTFGQPILSPFWPPQVERKRSFSNKHWWPISHFVQQSWTQLCSGHPHTHAIFYQCSTAQAVAGTAESENNRR
jgi:hypothetical protein